MQLVSEGDYRYLPILTSKRALSGHQRHVKVAGPTPRPASYPDKVSSWLAQVAKKLLIDGMCVSGAGVLRPGAKKASHRGDVCCGGGQIRVPEAGQAAEHLREDVPVEAPIDLGGLSEEIILGEVLRELEDGREVESLGPVEQGNDLAARQLTGGESRADEGGW